MGRMGGSTSWVQSHGWVNQLGPVTTWVRPLGPFSSLPSIHTLGPSILIHYTAPTAHLGQYLQASVNFWFTIPPSTWVAVHLGQLLQLFVNFSLLYRPLGPKFEALTPTSVHYTAAHLGQLLQPSSIFHYTARPLGSPLGPKFESFTPNSHWTHAHKNDLLR